MKKIIVLSAILASVSSISYAAGNHTFSNLKTSIYNSNIIFTNDLNGAIRLIPEQGFINVTLSPDSSAEMGNGTEGNNNPYTVSTTITDNSEPCVSPLTVPITYEVQDASTSTPTSMGTLTINYVFCSYQPLVEVEASSSGNSFSIDATCGPDASNCSNGYVTDDPNYSSNVNIKLVEPS